MQRAQVLSAKGVFRDPPILGFSECSLHNQTMTITWISEAA